jgi:ceramide glucosyltransferase
MIMTGLGLLAAVLMLAHLLAVGIYLVRLGRPQFVQGGLIGQPFVTLLRPVCGLDPFEEETLRASFLQDYPEYEIIFCAQSPNDPVIPLLRRLMAAYPEVPARLLVGQDQVSGNPKLNNVWKGWHAAASDWICMTDSNLLLPPDYLSTVVSTWGPRTGLVSSPPVGIRPEGLAGYLECAFLNGNQAMLQGAADSLGMGFAQGKTLFFNRPLLKRAGGLRRLGKTLAEDAAATRAIRGLGCVVKLTPRPFAQPIGRRTLSQVWTRQLRWSRVRRDAFPWLFTLEILNGGMVPIACAGMAVMLVGLPPIVTLAYAALWYLAEILLTWRAGWPLGRYALILPVLRDLIMPAIWIATFARRGFEWRGRTLAPSQNDEGGLPAPVTQ